MLQMLLVACMALIQDPQPKAYDLSSDSAIKVLFAGTHDEAHEKTFEDFLEQVFDQVDTIDLRELGANSAKGYDVVIADWEPTYADGRWGQRERQGFKWSSISRFPCRWSATWPDGITPIGAS